MGITLLKRNYIMARQTREERNEQQRVRQLSVRKTAKEQKKPSRDDIARLLLWQMITGIQKNKETDKAGKEKMLIDLLNSIVNGLESQGFDAQQSEDAFEALVDKYAKGGSPFRRKIHLTEGIDVHDL
jgi:hypothetical protein